MNAPASPPEITANDVVDEVVRVSKRDAIPIRYDFVQRRRANGTPAPGPLAGIVAAGDKRALILYLLLLSKASRMPWNAALPAAAWARALDLPLPERPTAAATVSKIWRRLETTHHLVERRRSGRRADIYLRHESGDPDAPDYTHPGVVGDPYFKVSFALWLAGPTDQDRNDTDIRWFQVLTLPELAALLIASTFTKPFRLPVERGPSWYGISSDTLNRGLKGLVEHGILNYEDNYRKAPLSKTGWRLERVYTLVEPFLIYETDAETKQEPKNPESNTKDKTGSKATGKKLPAAKKARTTTPAPKKAGTAKSAAKTAGKIAARRSVAK